ncbi:MAG: FecR domain-containing protein [Polyangiaceae bacterium]|jgi:ferric-dicitrate binding protein FerR (iron transport regulator)|nr:FecR domain-containing protein [Polyangiaceae bacterium]
MSDDYLWDKSGPPDPEVERLEGLFAPMRHEAPLSAPPRRAPRPPRRGPWIAGGLLAAAAAAALWLAVDRSGPGGVAPIAVESGDAAPSGPSPLARPPTGRPAVDCSDRAQGFPFEARGGALTCGGGAASAGRLPIGEWLETPADVTAKLSVADIGALELQPGSKLRITKTGKEEHRLELMRGRLSAKVDAPPRLFVIDTPAATAIDLGCAYELWVDERERSHLAVTSGAVSWEGKGRVVFVPAGAEAVAEPLRGPGTPIALDATKELRAAVASHDAGEPPALARVLELARASDSITLYTLLVDAGGRRGPEQRSARDTVARRMAALSLLPPRTVVSQLAAGEEASLVSVRDHLMTRWFPE